MSKIQTASSWTEKNWTQRGVGQELGPGQVLAQRVSLPPGDLRAGGGCVDWNGRGGVARLPTCWTWVLCFVSCVYKTGREVLC